jgi:dCMP deaminase
VRTIHAEMNAILQCAKFGISTEGAEIYITHFPCLACTKMILQAGIRKIYYLADYHNNEYALKLISTLKVVVEKVELSRKYFHKLTFGENDESFLFEANEE